MRIALLIAALGAALYFLYTYSDAAMQKCMVSHTQETCVETLR